MKSRSTMLWSGAPVALALLAMSAAAQAAVPGYVTTNQAPQVVTSHGVCVKTRYWNPSEAIAPCDAFPRAASPAPARVAAAAPTVTGEQAPVIEQVSLNSDLLFPFDSAQLRPEGKQKLDELADDLHNAKVQSIQALGYADPIGKEQYNQKLSDKRAQAVKSYLAQKGIDEQTITAEGRGEDTSQTGDRCEGLGPKVRTNKKLVQCLQPDRRVEVEVRGQREAAAGTQPPASSGATVR